MLASVPMPIWHDLGFKAPEPSLVNSEEPRMCQLSQLPNAAPSAVAGQLIVNMPSGKTCSSEHDSTHPAKMATSTSAPTDLVRSSMQQYAPKFVGCSRAAGTSCKNKIPSPPSAKPLGPLGPTTKGKLMSYIELINHNGTSTLVLS